MLDLRATRPPLHWNCYPQQSGLLRKRLQLSILQVGRDQEKLSRHKIDIGTAERTGKTANDGKLSIGRDLAWRIEIPFLDFEELVTYERLIFWLFELWCDIVEIDALQRLIDMQLPRLAFVVEAVPIEHPIRGVAVLLDLHQKVTCADRMKTSGGKKHRVAWFHRNGVNQFRNCS